MRCLFLLILLSLSIARPALADVPVVTVANLEFHSSFWLNLHHVLFGAAWARRPETGARRLTGALPAALPAPVSEDERTAWDAAVTYYEREMADRDLRTGRAMTAIKLALAAEDLASPSIDAPLRAVLERAAPIYKKHYWPEHDRANRQWIERTAQLLRTIEREIVTHHERVYGREWFPSPVRVDVVWVGRAYTTLNPVTHAVVSPVEVAALAEWARVEIVLHEVCHELILPTEKLLADALGKEFGDLWHAVQFYATGTILQNILRARGVEYSPYMYATGLFDRAWGRYRKAVEAAWGPYVREEITRAQAIERTAAALTGK